MNIVIFAAIIFGICVHHVISYSHGGPLRSCQTLLPNHGVDKQYGAAPYEIRATHGTNGNVIVTIASIGDEPFAGFMLQSRLANDREKIVHGRFSEDRQSQTRNCNGDVTNTLTHRSSSPKFKIETNWTPPKGFTGQVIFRTSIVQSKSVFWTAQDSSVIHIANVNNNNNNKNGNTNKGSEVSLNKIPDDHLPPEPSQSSSSSSSTQRLNYDECDRKFCFGLPEDCVQSKTCSMILIGSQNQDGSVEIKMTADPMGQKSRWWSMGFSTDDRMGDDTVTDCVLNSDGRVSIRNSVNLGKRNEPLQINEFHGVSNLNTSYHNGIVHCRWRRLRRSTIRGHQYDLQEKKYHILLATGELRDDSDSGKAIHDNRLASDDKVDLRQSGAIKGSSDLYLMRIHGSLMVIAWMGFVSMGILIARYYKQVWVSKEICGVKVWFACHRTLMLLSISFMIIASVCIYYFVGRYSIGAHQIVGTLALILGFLQPIGATLRPHPTAEHRWIFNWGHWLCGNIGQILAIVAIFLAYDLPQAQLPVEFLWIMMIFVICQVVSHCVLQIHACVMQNKSKKTADITMHDMRSGDTSMSNVESDPSGSGFRRFFLGIYFVVINGIVLAIVLCILLPNMSKDVIT